MVIGPHLICPWRVIVPALQPAYYEKTSPLKNDDILGEGLLPPQKNPCRLSYRKVLPEIVGAHAEVPAVLKARTRK